MYRDRNNTMEDIPKEAESVLKLKVFKKSFEFCSILDFRGVQPVSKHLALNFLKFEI